MNDFARLRHKRGLTQTQAGKLIGVSHKLVRRYEDGHLFATYGDQLERLEALNNKWKKEDEKIFVPTLDACNRIGRTS